MCHIFWLKSILETGKYQEIKWTQTISLDPLILHYWLCTCSSIVLLWQVMHKCVCVCVTLRGACAADLIGLSVINLMIFSLYPPRTLWLEGHCGDYYVCVTCCWCSSLCFSRVCVSVLISARAFCRASPAEILWTNTWLCLFSFFCSTSICIHKPTERERAHIEHIHTHHIVSIFHKYSELLQCHFNKWVLKSVQKTHFMGKLLRFRTQVPLKLQILLQGLKLI